MDKEERKEWRGSKWKNTERVRQKERSGVQKRIGKESGE